eukprot:6673024-Karenia_brevis.AAC.1
MLVQYTVAVLRGTAACGGCRAYVSGAPVMLKHAGNVTTTLRQAHPSRRRMLPALPRLFL